MRDDDFVKKILNWYAENQRVLPWRQTSDPYRIWLSEIMLQQTRVLQGLPYYERFIKEFPTVESLAKAPQQKILRLWQGLGYYSRARNLHACAKRVVEEFGGKFPEKYSVLLELPGIGNYTAAAIASIAFNQRVAVVDGNVFRVLSRVFGVEFDISSTIGKAAFSSLANRLVDSSQPGIYNQAIMEFGALYCTPKNPECNQCIFKRSCFANQKDLQDFLPYKARKMKTRNRYFTYFVIRAGRQLAMKKRIDKDIWTGLFDFYLEESSRVRKPEKVLEENPFLKKLQPHTEVEVSKPFKHVLSHQVIYTRFVTLRVKSSSKVNTLLKTERLRLYDPKTVQSLPKPVLVVRFLDEKDF